MGRENCQLCIGGVGFGVDVPSARGVSEGEEGRSAVAIGRAVGVFLAGGASGVAGPDSCLRMRRRAFVDGALTLVCLRTGAAPPALDGASGRAGLRAFLAALAFKAGTVLRDAVFFAAALLGAAGLGPLGDAASVFRFVVREVDFVVEPRFAGVFVGLFAAFFLAFFFAMAPLLSRRTVGTRKIAQL